MTYNVALISAVQQSDSNIYAAAAAAAKLLQSCLTLSQTPPSLGFSRQEHWSGLPFPFPMHESEKWEWSHSVVSNSKWPHGLQPTRLLRPWDFPGKNTGVGCHGLHIYIYIYIYTFFMLFALMVYHRISNVVPCAVGPCRALLFIHFTYDTVHLLTPNSQSIPPPSLLPLGNHNSVFYICESVSIS